jgi:hypothetical protein
MLAKLHHYEELQQHVSFFKDWFGVAWEQMLQEHIGVSEGEIRGVMQRKKSFNPTLLPRLRKLRATVMDAWDRLAKPSLDALAAVTAQRHEKGQR